MSSIFFRHVLRDILTATAAVIAVLLVLMVTYQLAFVLGRAADGQIPAQMVFQLVALSMRQNITVILPFAVLLGSVLGLGRLYHDSEMAAAQACGVGLRPVYLAAGLVTLLAASIGGWISFVDGPRAAVQSRQLRLEALRTAVTRGLAPGQFRPLGNGATLYFQARDPDGTLREVFVQQRMAPIAGAAARMHVVLADRARYEISVDSDFYTITLFDGESHEGTPGQGSWRVMKFREQTVRVPTPDAALPGAPRVDGLSTATLAQSSDPRYQGEWQWRIATVLITLTLGLLAVPLARLRPRQGRYSRVIWAVLLYAVYTGLLIAGRSVLERGDTPLWLGLWWVHVVATLLGAALILMPRFNDWRARRRESV
jgi:lipopolysaccharide export system permease protein